MYHKIQFIFISPNILYIQQTVMNHPFYHSQNTIDYKISFIHTAFAQHEQHVHYTKRASTYFTKKETPTDIPKT